MSAKESNERPERTAEMIRDEALRRALNTPPTPHKPKDKPSIKGKANRKVVGEKKRRRTD